MTQFPGKVVWITGASEGIGRALTVAFAAAGATVIASARQGQALAALASEQAGAISPQRLDVTDMEGIRRVSETVLERFGRVDYLINNAGISQRSLIVDTEIEVYRRLMEVNFFGAVAMTQALLPSMRRAGSGHISVIGSPAGRFATPLRSGYCAAKHAAHAFFESLRAELAEDGIGVTVIVPGPIHTNVTVNALTGAGERYGRMEEIIASGISPEDCARAILAGLAAGDDEIQVVTPAVQKMLDLCRDDPPAFFERIKSLGPR